tara:strand:+ start:76 stop:411 length:336 start_codon:yes stop_codon:yes gene_type:complete
MRDLKRTIKTTGVSLAMFSTLGMGCPNNLSQLYLRKICDLNNNCFWDVNRDHRVDIITINPNNVTYYSKPMEEKIRKIGIFKFTPESKPLTQEQQTRVNTTFYSYFREPIN